MSASQLQQCEPTAARDGPQGQSRGPGTNARSQRERCPATVRLAAPAAWQTASLGGHPATTALTSAPGAIPATGGEISIAAHTLRESTTEVLGRPQVLHKQRATLHADTSAPQSATSRS